MRRVLLALALVLALPATASAATLHATPSTFAATFSSAAGGDTVLLASGSYGSWGGGAKSSMVTVASESGAAVSFSGGTFGSAVRNITIKGVVYTGPVEVNPGSTPLNLVFDGDTWGDVGHAAHEGRLFIGNPNAANPNGVHVRNSTFGPGGCSDGIQDSSRGTEIGPGNEFKGIVQGSCSEHADAIQPYASNYVWIHDNYLHDNEQGIMSPDGLSVGYLIEGNSIHTTPGYPCMHLGDTRDGTVRHNVCRNGAIRVYGGNQGVSSQNMRVVDNVGGANNEGCTGCTFADNPPVSSVTFAGGPGLCGWATASPVGTATDGTNVGVNCGAAPPPPPADTDGDGVGDSTDLCPGTPVGTAVDANGCPFGTPPPALPVARFTVSPEPSVPGQVVTFDATTSACADAPCTYHWHDVGSGGASNYPLGSDGATMTFAFQGLGTKYVELVVTDASGDVSRITHNHVVAAPVDNLPTARFTASPEPSVRQQTVTFDATSSTCQDTPCRYHWHDVGSNGTSDYPLGPDGATMTFAFQGLGTKYVELVLTDADGDVSKVRHNHVVR